MESFGAEELTLAWVQRLFPGGTGIKYRGVWTPGTDYLAGDVVSFADVLYLAGSTVPATDATTIVGTAQRSGVGALVLPAGTQVGDLILVAVCLRSNGSDYPNTVAGATQIEQADSFGFGTDGKRSFYDCSWLVADSTIVSAGQVVIPTQAAPLDLVAYAYVLRNAQIGSSRTMTLAPDSGGLFFGLELASSGSPASSIDSSYPPIGTASLMIGFGAVHSTGTPSFGDAGAPYVHLSGIISQQDSGLATAMTHIEQPDWWGNYRTTNNAYALMTVSDYSGESDGLASTVRIDWKAPTGQADPRTDPAWQQFTVAVPAAPTGTDSFSSLRLGLQATATDTESLAVGTGAKALGYQSGAVGNFAEAHLNQDMALGTFAYAEGTPPSWALFQTGGALAVGGSATSHHAVTLGGTASGVESTSVGHDSEASGTWATAVGSGASALADGSVALGFTYPVQLGADFAVAIGNAALVTSDSAEAVIIGDASFAVDNAPNSVGIGFSAGCEHTSPNAVAIGYAADASGAPNAIALGAVSFAGADSVIAIGHQAVATGDQGNVVIGRGAVARAQNIVAIGDYALGQSTSSATSNTAVGTNSLGNVTTGQFNTALGAFSLGDLTTGDHNTVIGEESALDLVDGHYNTFLGQDTGNGHTLISGGYNTFVGCLTSVSTDVSGALVIGCNSDGVGAVAGGYDTIVIGGGSVGQASKSITIGINATTTHYDDIAIGQGSSADQGGTALGALADATGYQGVALGRGAAATSSSPGSSIAIGYSAVAEAAHTMALGATTRASGAGAVAIGVDNVGNPALAPGVNDFILGTSNHKVSLPGLVGFHGAAPVAQAASPGTATGTDAAVINALTTILRNHGLCS